MYPDTIHHQAPGQDSLPEVQNAPGAVSPAVSAQQPLPVQLPAANIAANVQPVSLADQIKLLVKQYGGNPYAFNAAFQQLKSRYLQEQYHIDLSVDKK